MKKFDYFVSFAYDNGKGLGFGNARITSNHLITTMADIKSIENQLIDNTTKIVILLNYQLLNESEVDE